MNNTSLYKISGIMSLCILLYSCGNKEIVKLKNPINGERIYIIRYEWPPDGARIGISNNKELDAWVVYKDKYIIENDGYLLYKFDYDTLVVYSCGSKFKEPQGSVFKSPIKIIELNNIEFINLLKGYKFKKMGLSFFPSSSYYIIENRN